MLHLKMYIVASKDWDVRKYCCFSLKSPALYFPWTGREWDLLERMSLTPIFYSQVWKKQFYETSCGAWGGAQFEPDLSVIDQLRFLCGGTMKTRMLMEDVLSCSLCVIPRRVKKPSASVAEAPTFPLTPWTERLVSCVTYPDVFGWDDIMFICKNKGLSFLFQDERFWDKSYAFSVISALMKSRTGTVFKHPSVWKSFQKRC